MGPGCLQPFPMPPCPGPSLSPSMLCLKWVGAGMNQPVSPSWWKSRRPEKGQFKGFGGQMLPMAGSGGAALSSHLLLLLA